MWIWTKLSALALVNVVVTIAVNVAYVASVTGTTVKNANALATFLGIFKALWTFMILRIMRRYGELQARQLEYFQVGVAVFNTIIAPCSVVVLTTQACFLSVFGQTSVTVPNTYYVACTIAATNTTACPSYDTFSSNDGYAVDPPFLYSYQCSSYVLVNYTPVMLSTFWSVSLLAVIKLMKSAILAVHPTFFDFPWILKTAASTTASNGVAPVRPLFSKYICTYDLYVHAMVLLTFGIACPFLAMLIAWSYFIKSACAVMHIGRALCRVDEPVGSRTAAFDGLRKAYDHTLGPMCIIVFTAVLFWAIFGYDMVGDVSGPIAGQTAALLIVFVIPAVIAVALGIILLVLWRESIFGTLTHDTEGGIAMTGVRVAHVFQNDRMNSTFYEETMEPSIDAENNSRIDNRCSSSLAVAPTKHLL